MSPSIHVLVIGGGPAGMMAAIAASRPGYAVTLLEKNPILGKKLLITGKGRCNVTNDCDVETLVAHVPQGGRFLYGAFSRFASRDTVEFFESLGVPLKTERGNRVFPVSDSAAQVRDAMAERVRQAGVAVRKGVAKELLAENGAVSGVLLESGERIPADRVIVAAGGVSYPGTGSTGDGYRLAKQAGHTVVPPSPSLVPLVCREKWSAELMGLSLRNTAVTVTDLKKKKTLYSDFGELLFTHFGLSGPVILSASAHLRDMEPDRYRITLDLKPALTAEQLDARILRDFSLNLNRDFQNSLGKLLPAKLIPVAVRLSGIEPERKVHSVTKEQRRAFVSLLKGLSLTVAGYRPVEEAIITRGGVSLKEVDPSSMQSKLLPGLFFAGEVLDADAYTGGFNLQIAFSTGRLAGMSV